MEKNKKRNRSVLNSRKNYFVNRLESQNIYKDIKFKVYKIVWHCRIQECFKEIIRHMYWNKHDVGYVCRKTGESMFNFRFLNTHDKVLYRLNNQIYNVVKPFGTFVTIPIQESLVIGKLPSKYYTHF